MMTTSTDRLSSIVKYTQKLDKLRETRRKSGFLYLLRSGQYIKVGITVDMVDRLKSYRTHNPIDMEVIVSIPMTMKKARRLEQWILGKYAMFAHRGEWLLLPKEAEEKLVNGLPKVG